MAMGEYVDSVGYSYDAMSGLRNIASNPLREP